MKFLIILAVITVGCNARSVMKRGVNGDQKPKWLDALVVLRGGKQLTVEDQQNILKDAVPGKDFPINAVIPDKNLQCTSYKQPGFYADDDSQSRCQVFHRCDLDGTLTSYLCPNETLFNQITLICDWFYNIDCSISKQFQEYSNSRLWQEGLLLLDDQMVFDATGAVSSQ